MNRDMIMDRVGKALAGGDRAGAKELLALGLQQAEAAGDSSTALALESELLPLLRAEGDQKALRKHCGLLLRRVETMKNGGTVSGATALVNCGCACVFLGELPTAELLFSKAAKVFQCLLPEGDLRFAALYNDMAMLFAVQGEAEQAESYFGKAIAAAQKSSEAQAHEAGIWLNLAGLAARTKGFYEGEEEISDGIARAMELLEREEIPGDREYAWLCRSYAPVFERFGYGMHGEELLQRARSICAKLQNEGRLPL